MIRQILLLGIATLVLPAAAGLESYMVGPSEEPIDGATYTWGSPETTSYFQDAQSYEDVALMVCDSTDPGEVYIGLEYLMNSEIDPLGQLVSYGDTNLALASKEASFDGKQCRRTGFGSFVVSPSEIPGDPETGVAAFPAETYTLVSESQDGSSLEFLKTEGGKLRGEFEGGISYDRNSNKLVTEVESVSVLSNLGEKTFSVSEAGRGLSEKRKLVFGACTDRDGQNCPAGVQKASSGTEASRSFPMDVPESQIDDQSVYTRYGVANGITYDTVKIGANLRLEALDFEDSLFHSQNQTVTATIRNTGNVHVDTDFSTEISIRKDGEVLRSENFETVKTIDPSDKVDVTLEWPAEVDSGSYTVTAETDLTDSVVEISETDNAVSRSFQVRPVTEPEILVDEQAVGSGAEFPEAGRPYNLTILLEDSDGNPVSNAEMVLREEDGTSSLAPTQELDSGFTGTVTEISFQTGPDGEARLTVSPRGNALLSEKYSDLEVQDRIDYSLSLRGSQDGSRLRFIENGSVKTSYPLEVSDPGRSVKGGRSDLPNLDEYVKIGMNRVYRVFTAVWGAVT
jgi:hypothetical protein